MFHNLHFVTRFDFFVKLLGRKGQTSINSEASRGPVLHSSSFPGERQAVNTEEDHPESCVYPEDKAPGATDGGRGKGLI